MDEHDAWFILAEQGILIEPIAADRSSWQYAFPMLEPTWYGSYDTRNDALRAALRHLLLLAQHSISATGQVPTTQTSAEKPSTDLAIQLKTLKAMWHELQLARARVGIKESVDLDLRIKHVEEQIALLKQQAMRWDNE